MPTKQDPHGKPDGKGGLFISYESNRFTIHKLNASTKRKKGVSFMYEPMANHSISNKFKRVDWK